MSEFSDELKSRDLDRWLSSRFVADADQRARLEALYILDLEWAKAAAQPNALAAEVRLAWWREAVERFAGCGAADHPALATLGREAAGRLRPQLEEALDAWADRLEEDARSAMTDAAVSLLDPATSVASPSLRAFPAVAHQTLEPAYAAGRTPGPLEKQVRVLWAVLTGRL